MENKLAVKFAGALLAASLVLPLAACSEDEFSSDNVATSSERPDKSQTRECAAADYQGFENAAEAIEFSDVVVVAKFKSDEVLVVEPDSKGSMEHYATLSSMEVVEVLKGEIKGELVVSQDGGIAEEAGYCVQSTRYLTEYPAGQEFLLLLKQVENVDQLLAWNPQQSINLVNGEEVNQTSASRWHDFDTLDDVRKLISGG